MDVNNGSGLKRMLMEEYCYQYNFTETGINKLVEYYFTHDNRSWEDDGIENDDYNLFHIKREIKNLVKDGKIIKWLYNDQKFDSIDIAKMFRLQLDEVDYALNFAYNEVTKEVIVDKKIKKTFNIDNIIFDDGYGKFFENFNSLKELKKDYKNSNAYIKYQFKFDTKDDVYWCNPESETDWKTIFDWTYDKSLVKVSSRFHKFVSKKLNMRENGMLEFGYTAKEEDKINNLFDLVLEYLQENFMIECKYDYINYEYKLIKRK